MLAPVVKGLEGPTPPYQLGAGEFLGSKEDWAGIGPAETASKNTDNLGLCIFQSVRGQNKRDLDALRVTVKCEGAGYCMREGVGSLGKEKEDIG